VMPRWLAVLLGVVAALVILYFLGVTVELH
jgi:hypothetical protein